MISATLSALRRDEKTSDAMFDLVFRELRLLVPFSDAWMAGYLVALGRIRLQQGRIADARAAEQLPNLAIPEMNGVGAMELPVSVAEGVCDFISAMDTRRIQEWNTWYHVLNCGFPAFRP